MSRYCVRLELSIRPTEPGDDVDLFTNDFADALLSLDPDADVMGSVTTGLFQVWVHADADNVVDAVLKGTATIRCAGHAAEADTAYWPSADEWPQWIETRSVEAHVVDEDDEHDPESAELAPA